MTEITPRTLDLQLEERTDDELAAMARAIAEQQDRNEKERIAKGKREVIAVAKKYGLNVTFGPERKRGRKRKIGTD